MFEILQPPLDVVLFGVFRTEFRERNEISLSKFRKDALAVK